MAPGFGQYFSAAFRGGSPYIVFSGGVDVPAQLPLSPTCDLIARFRDFWAIATMSWSDPATRRLSDPPELPLNSPLCSY